MRALTQETPLKRVFAATLLAFVAVIDTVAADAPDKTLAREFIEARGYEKAYAQYLARFSLFCSDAPEEAQSACLKSLQDKIGWDAIKTDVLDLVISTYTKEELQAAIAFLKSPVGSSYNAKGEQFATKLQALSTDRLQGMMSSGSPAAPSEKGSVDKK